MHGPVLMVSFLVILCAACGRAPPPPPFKAVADNKLLMQSVIDPNADLVWDSVKTIITSKGTQEFRPRSEEEWGPQSAMQPWPSPSPETC